MGSKDTMKLFAIIGLGVCVYYFIEVVSKWENRNAIEKGIWFAFLAICVGLCLFIFFYELSLRVVDLFAGLR